MGFQFSLDAVLRLRQSLERQQEILLRAASQQVALLRQEIEALGRALAEIAAQEERELESGVRAAELQFDLLRAAVLRRRRAALETDLAAAEAVRKSRSQDFQRALRQRETVESLRRQQFQVYTLHEKRQEQRRLDDLFLLRREFLRRKNQAP